MTLEKLLQKMNYMGSDVTISSIDEPIDEYNNTLLASASASVSSWVPM